MIKRHIVSHYKYKTDNTGYMALISCSDGMFQDMCQYRRLFVKPVVCNVIY